ncbi:MAG: rubredoxin [Rudanella sp.]|nr:rubredoxin [Rudanella sp.]
MTKPLRILTHGGSIAPNDLRQLVGWAANYGLTSLEVSNRQSLLLNLPSAITREDMARRIHDLGLPTDEADSHAMNIVSSLPATDVFPDTPWLTAGVYLDVLAQFTTAPRLKVNLIDPAQSLVAPFTGNVNFVASPEPNYWYVFLRPSGSVRRYQWPILIESEFIASFVRAVEKHYFGNPADTGVRATLDTFYRAVMADFQGRTRKVAEDLKLPQAIMPLYEGFHQTRNGNCWLGLYRKNYAFSLEFITALCDLCRDTRMGKLYLTPYKTLLIKDIREGDRPAWDRLLGRFGVRTNLPAWHLNWQLPDADEQTVLVRNQVLNQLDDTDVRTDALSFALNIPFSEAAASVVLQRNGSETTFDMYQRTGYSTTNSQYVLFAKSQPMAALSESIRQLSMAYYERLSSPETVLPEPQPEASAERPKILVHQCPNCLSRYDAHFGEPHRSISAGTAFGDLTEYVCGVCEGEKAQFKAVWAM